MFIQDNLQEACDLLAQFNCEKNHKLIAQAIDDCAKSLSQGGKILSCGNGGSLCDAAHFAEELTGRYRKDRPPLAALALQEPGHLTCVGNDFGFDFIFSRLVESLGKPEDVLLAISTSGNSKNVIHAVESAKEKGMTTIGLLGKEGGKLLNMVDIPLYVEHQKTERVQEIHIKVIHNLIEGIERKLFPDFY